MIKRNKALDIARGICIFLIVLSHSYCSWKSWFTFYYVQVFFFLSGIFLTKSHTLEKSLYKKIKSLIFPYLFFGIICSILVLATKRTSIENLHIYDPDSFDNGPQWFLIALFTLTTIILTFNQIGKRYISIIGSILIFIICYFLGLKQIDDYTNLTKAGISIPFILAGTYYFKIENILKRNKYLLLFISIITCYIFIKIYPINIGIRWLILPQNPIEYLLASVGGIGFILSISYSLEKIKIINNTFSFWGLYSLFILCIHWPIIRILYDKLLPSSFIKADIISIIICIIICTITSYTGRFLKNKFTAIF